jgi:hypothetical protein
MTIEEKKAWLILFGFTTVAVVCAALLILGPAVLDWEEKHIYLVCLSLMAVAHLFWLIPYIISRKVKERTGIAVDERDAQIFGRANAVAARLCCAFFFGSTFLLGLIGVNSARGLIGAQVMLLLVLIGSFVFMITLSITSLILYRVN